MHAQAIICMISRCAGIEDVFELIFGKGRDDAIFSGKEWFLSEKGGGIE